MARSRGLSYSRSSHGRRVGEMTRVRQDSLAQSSWTLPNNPDRQVVTPGGRRLRHRVLRGSLDLEPQLLVPNANLAPSTYSKSLR